MTQDLIKPEPKVVSKWANVYKGHIGLDVNSRLLVDLHVKAERLCVLRIDWCDGDVSFHKEEN